MLLFLNSSASLSIFSMSFLELQLQLEQPKLVARSRSFSLPVLAYCNCLPFTVFLTHSFCPKEKRYKKGDTFFSFVPHNYVRSSMLNDMICLDIKITKCFGLVIRNYTCRFVIIPLNLAN